MKQHILAICTGPQCLARACFKINMLGVQIRTQVVRCGSDYASYEALQPFGGSTYSVLRELVVHVVKVEIRSNRLRLPHKYTVQKLVPLVFNGLSIADGNDSIVTTFN